LSDALVECGGFDRECERVAGILQSMAVTYEKMKRYHEALDCYANSLRMRRKLYDDNDYHHPPPQHGNNNSVKNNSGNKKNNINHNQLFGILKYQIGNCHFLLNNDDYALDFFKDALIAFKRTGDQSCYDEYTQTLNKMIAVYARRNALEIVIECYNDLLSLLQQGKTSPTNSKNGSGLPNFDANKITFEDRMVLVGTLERKARVQVKLGHYAAAMKAFERCLSILQQIQSNQEQRQHQQQFHSNPPVQQHTQPSIARILSATLQCLGATAYSCGEYGKSLRYFQECMDRFPPDHYQKQESQDEEQLAMSKKKMTPFSSTTTSAVDKVGILNAMAIIHTKQGRHQSALDHYRSALKMIRSQFSGQHEELVSILINQGNVYCLLDDLDSCLECYEKAQTTLDELQVGQTGCELELAGLNYNLGIAHYQLGSYDEARDYFQETLEFNLVRVGGSGITPVQQEQHGGDSEIDMAAVFNSLANISMMENAYESAINYYNRSIQVRRMLLRKEMNNNQYHNQQHSNNQNNSNSHHHSSNNFEGAGGGNGGSSREDYHSAALIGTLSNLAVSYLKIKSYTKAIKAMNDAFISLQELGQVSPDLHLEHLTAKLQNQLGNVLLAQKKLDFAMQSYGKALRIVSGLMKKRKSVQRSRLTSFSPPMDEWQQQQQVDPIDNQLELEMQRTRHGIGLVLCRKGQLDEAMELFQDVLVQRKKMLLQGESGEILCGHPEVGKLLCDMSRIELLKQSFDQARCYLDDAINMFSTSENMSRHHPYVKEAGRIGRKIQRRQKTIVMNKRANDEMSAITEATPSSMQIYQRYAREECDDDEDGDANTE